jgi:hypothetical protein
MECAEIMPTSLLGTNITPIQNNKMQTTSSITFNPVPRNKQKKFGSNQNKPKRDLFRFRFGLFRETKSKKFRFVTVCFGVLNFIKTIETIRTVSKQTETNRKNPKFS